MKTYNKEVLRYDKNSNEARYTCSVCNLENHLSMSFKLSYYNEYKSYLRCPVWTSISCCMSEDLGTLIRRE